MKSELTSVQRDTLRLFALTLIPSSPDGPSADEAEVAPTWIDVTLAERPDLVPGVLRILDAYDGSEPRLYLERLEREAKGDFAKITYAIAGSYFKSPVAKEWLGFARILDEYESAEPEPTKETMELLQPVLARGAFYRPTSLRRHPLPEELS
ncbi:hypothetical protein [Candidatus Aquiluna sp. UB-MaderosW2red]|uniref:hypothetical protein n=1 Tax=Candidatus Aquiluna sp. UB-MaderosW2red TaxID=1855377 RepID=UPI000875DB5F|nr:hypothetical protein [Candidatus Aquiluna sp. UB-MaderosW2red]SCX05313.1 hypothetical protein SAMN05216534_0376 [Candidatus Aquiluna sp. UB-MaderosW2red]